MNFLKSHPVSSKGFLFTIAVILFASTLTIYAQSYSSVNFAAERSIISSAKPLNVLLLNDDLAFDVLKLFRLSIDVNNSSPNDVLIFGDFLSSRDVSTEFSNYSSFLTSTFFSRSHGTESLNVGALTDGKGELLFGGSAQLDYNYGNNLFLFPTTGTLESIDLNINSPDDLSSIVWSPSAGGVELLINYLDDSNRFTISSSIAPDALSSLKILYADGNTWIYLGESTLNGYTKSSSVALVPKAGQKMRFSMRAKYSAGSVLLPVKANSVLSVRGDSVDSNSFLTIER